MSIKILYFSHLLSNTKMFHTVYQANPVGVDLLSHESIFPNKFA